MSKYEIDHEALIERFSQATARQGEALRKAVEEATLRALQGRELTLNSVRAVLKSTTHAASAGAAKGGLGQSDVEALLTRAVEGMDAALVKAVDANRRALEQFVDQGAELGQTQVKKALADIEKMEDVLFSSVHKAAADAGQSVQAPWALVLEGFKAKGSATGASAASALEQLTSRAQASSRQGRALAQGSVEAWMEHHAALARGVLIGLSARLDAPARASAKAPGRARKG